MEGGFTVIARMAFIAVTGITLLLKKKKKSDSNAAASPANTTDHESEESRLHHTQLAQMLAPHFALIQYFIDVLEGKKTTNKMKLQAVLRSIHFLHIILQADHTFVLIVEELREFIEIPEVDNIFHGEGAQTDVTIRKELLDKLEDLSARFHEHKQVYLKVI
jgi:hypothetical protein